MQGCITLKINWYSGANLSTLGLISNSFRDEILNLYIHNLSLVIHNGICTYYFQSSIVWGPQYVTTNFIWGSRFGESS
ncbi:unnamed protein product [Schistosoma curassoni]|nr:unnamed protein product [Schistosoma curassoni]